MRPPDFIVGNPGDPYLLRWHLIPRNRFFNVYLHKFLRDDDDRALHDHPWASLSIVLRGGYYEIKPGPDGTEQRRWYGRLSAIFRRATHQHRIELPKDKRPCWTLFLTGPNVREWGFHCPQGWVHWEDFVDQTDHGNIGRGCGE